MDQLGTTYCWNAESQLGKFAHQGDVQSQSTCQQQPLPQVASISTLSQVQLSGFPAPNCTLPHYSTSEVATTSSTYLAANPLALATPLSAHQSEFAASHQPHMPLPHPPGTILQPTTMNDHEEQPIHLSDTSSVRHHHHVDNNKTDSITDSSLSLGENGSTSVPRSLSETHVDLPSPNEAQTILPAISVETITASTQSSNHDSSDNNSHSPTITDNNDNNEAATATSSSSLTMVLPTTHKRRRATSSAFEQTETKCHFCPKRVAQSDQLAAHMVQCYQGRPNECDRCSKRFKTKAGLQQHQKTHTQERPYQCTFCDKTFIQKCHVDQHERIHTGDKPYECAFCGRTFRQRSQQQQHEATHDKTQL